MPTLGTDCHIILTHTDVNGGSGYGFILSEDQPGHPAVTIQRELESDGTTNIRVFFQILLADDLLDPDGGQHSASRDTDYAMLEDYLAQNSGIAVSTPVGVFSAIGASGHTATEQHFPNHSLVACQLNNIGEYFSPADQADYLASVWDGTLTWATSYWR
jgi:hypothetical protein